MGPKSRWGGGVGSSGDRLCQTSLIPRSPDGDNNVSELITEYQLKPIWADINIGIEPLCTEEA